MNLNLEYVPAYYNKLQVRCMLDSDTWNCVTYGWSVATHVISCGISKTKYLANKSSHLKLPPYQPSNSSLFFNLVILSLSPNE